MDFQDKNLPCDTCGGTFPFTAQEAAFYAEKGFSPPKRCEGARRARKQSGISERYSQCPFGPDGRGGPRGAGGGGEFRGRSGPSRGNGAPRGPRPRPTGLGVFASGEVSQVSRDRGFGFIAADDGRSFFFDAQELMGLDFDSLTRGLRVEFEEAESPRGPRARDVRAAD